MGFFQDLFGGGSIASDTGASNLELQMEKTMQANATQYGNLAQEDLSRYAGELNLISTGNTGLGYSPEYTAATNAQIAAQTAGTAEHTIQAMRQSESGAAGGAADTTANLAARAATAQAAQQADIAGTQQKLAFLKSNLDQGRLNAEQFAAGLKALAGTEIQQSQFAQQGAMAETEAWKKTEDQISQARSGMLGNILGTATSLISPVAGMIKGGFGNLAPSGQASFGEQIMNFMQGMGGGTTGPGPSSFYAGAGASPIVSGASTPSAAAPGFDTGLSQEGNFPMTLVG
jgi:hypothetical protein